MNISDEAQEILERYWIENKENTTGWKMEVGTKDPIAAELIKTGYAGRDGNKLELTQEGWKEAHSCIRRHRLAERLFADVLDIKKDILHEVSCKFEHVLQKSVEENICTLLGHPTSCPHGKPIPEGSCCRDDKRSPRQLVLALSEFEVDDKGKIAYIRADKGNIMNKLTAIGVLPGLSIQLLRKTPSYLFQMGESQFAIDKKLASHIYLRLL